MATYAVLFVLGMILLIWGNTRGLYTVIPVEKRRRITGGRVIGAILVLIATFGVLVDLIAPR